MSELWCHCSALVFLRIAVILSLLLPYWIVSSSPRIFSRTQEASSADCCRTFSPILPLIEEIMSGTAIPTHR